MHGYIHCRRAFLNVNALEVLGGLVLSSLIAWVGYRRASLSGSGAVGAVLIGTIIFGLGGWVWGLLLISFFVTSSALSHYKGREKESLAEKFAKGSRRDLGQTLANGGFGMLLALLHPLFPAHESLLFVIYAGAMATVNADTWATELGVLSQQAPRLITTGRRVVTGTSGGVSTLGTGASLAGALVIALLAVLLRGMDGRAILPLLWLLPIVTLSGLAGSLLDSLLGATVQTIYYCDTCQKETERPVHRCGQPTRRLRGWQWLDNDSVNLISSIVGGLLAGLAWGVLVSP
ncbi:MAG: DUF92 domain-containing protein [Chloroflexi bacterium]|nr:DUF92 domain-containing protein [Chloroflexota bacterium]MBU1879695.1 DUF92 domain-containing protein [Chloroflexota bacterium]